jgi:hypothetical protein
LLQAIRGSGGATPAHPDGTGQGWHEPQRFHAGCAVIALLQRRSPPRAEVGAALRSAVHRRLGEMQGPIAFGAAGLRLQKRFWFSTKRMQIRVQRQYLVS